jgi:hypothetical protein
MADHDVRGPVFPVRFFVSRSTMQSPVLPLAVHAERALVPVPLTRQAGPTAAVLRKR